jgi:hypothetical protein
MNFTMPARAFFHLILNRQWPSVIITYWKINIFGAICRGPAAAAEMHLRVSANLLKPGGDPGGYGGVFPENLSSGYFSFR